MGVFSKADITIMIMNLYITMYQGDKDDDYGGDVNDPQWSR